MTTTTGIKNYYHTQSTAAATWVVNHNLNESVIVEVFAYDSGVLKKAFPVSVIQTNLNTVTIHWSSSRQGTVRIISA